MFREHKESTVLEKGILSIISFEYFEVVMKYADSLLLEKLSSELLFQS